MCEYKNPKQGQYIPNVEFKNVGIGSARLSLCEKYDAKKAGLSLLEKTVHFSKISKDLESLKGFFLIH